MNHDAIHKGYGGKPSERKVNRLAVVNSTIEIASISLLILLPGSYLHAIV